jgi:hypothetical protein
LKQKAKPRSLERPAPHQDQDVWPIAASTSCPLPGSASLAASPFPRPNCLISASMSIPSNKRAVVLCFGKAFPRSNRVNLRSQGHMLLVSAITVLPLHYQKNQKSFGQQFTHLVRFGDLKPHPVRFPISKSVKRLAGSGSNKTG